MSGTASIATTGNAGSATKLKDARTINGTSFNGTGNITTSKWGTARTIGLSGAVSGSASVDGSGNVTISTTQANIAVLTGNKSIAASSDANVTISYPSGFTANNSVLISCGIKVTDVQGYEYTGDFHDAMSLYWNAYTKYVNLTSNNINLHLSNPKTSETTVFYYKLVLMKIS